MINVVQHGGQYFNVPKIIPDRIPRRLIVSIVHFQLK